MWPRDFAARLTAWTSLRDACHLEPAQQALERINAWWFAAPWSSYYLHWDDRRDWPDPWQILSDDIYCEVARGLGMLYTIAMLDRSDIADAELQDCANGTVLQVLGGKYILNWVPSGIVNINPDTGAVRHRVQQQEILKKYNLCAI